MGMLEANLLWNTILMDFLGSQHQLSGPGNDIGLGSVCFDFSSTNVVQLSKLSNLLLISTGFLKFPFQHSFQIGTKIQL